MKQVHLEEIDVQKLIMVGYQEQSDDLLQYFTNRDFINRLHWEEWREFAVTLKDEELINLFKGLVIIEKQLNWLGGSVAGAIWIYKIIQERNLDTNKIIADFGLKNSDNPWIPYGFPIYNRSDRK